MKPRELRSIVQPCGCAPCSSSHKRQHVDSGPSSSGGEHMDDRVAGEHAERAGAIGEREALHSRAKEESTG